MCGGILIFSLKIKWKNRFRNDRNKTAKVTVDGTDFRICEPQPFSSQWFSSKFNGPGVRYELAVCIQTGDIVWMHGPFPCGSWPDIKIFRSKLKNKLLPNEMVEADLGYRGERETVRTPKDFVSLSDKKAKARARSRHETVNGRLKNWGCLKQCFRHNIGKHKMVFTAVAVITQLDFEHGAPPFQCNY